MKFTKIIKRKLRLLQWSPVFIRFALKGNQSFYRIPTHMTVAERLLLYHLACAQKEKSVIVEVGSYLGASSSFLASAAKEKNHHVYCVDTWLNDGMSEGKRDTYEEFCTNIAPVRDCIHVLRGTSVQMSKVFKEEIDLLFIDGDHTYAACKEDVVNWLPKVKNGGVVVLHDVAWSKGVRSVVDEFIRPVQKEEKYIDNIYWARINKNDELV
jgi:predicted O-methyltransferase YrrM